jgi:Domain of unknown function (DUF4440)
MRRCFVALTAVLALVSPSLASQLPGQPEAIETALAKIDLKQKDLVAKADVTGLTALAAPGLTINAPTGRVLTREQFLAMMRNGQIGAERFERKVESVTVAGDVGAVMGSEVFTPTAESELGRTYGAVPLKRRYTNIYIRDHGAWRWFARHANVVPTK